MGYLLRATGHYILWPCLRRWLAFGRAGVVLAAQIATGDGSSGSCPPLLGVVEVDEMYVGGPEKEVHGRYTEKKAIVAVAVEVVDEKRLGRVRLRRVADVSGEALRPFVQEAVEPGSSVLTDAWGGYTGLSGLGYDHMVINQSASPDPAHTDRNAPRASGWSAGARDLPHLTLTI